MKNQLITRISSDLNVERYEKESESDFSSRLIYTVISCWIRYFIFDKSNNDSDTTKKSKKYIMARGKDIIKNYLDLFPECEQYFLFKERNNKKIRVETDEVIRTIRERMLNAGEIFEINPNKYISIPKYYKENIYKNIIREYGINNDEFKSIHLGITRIKTNEDYKNDNEILKIINPEELLSWLIKNAKWEKFNSIEKLEIFNSKSKKIPSKSWNLDKSNILKGNVYLAKQVNNFRKWETQYFLLKKDNDRKYCISKIKDVLIDWKEHRRIIHALRKINNNPSKVQVKNVGNYKKLSLFSGLPLKEQIILETYCWPNKNMYNTREYIVSNEVWEYIKYNLTNLYIEVEEVL